MNWKRGTDWNVGRSPPFSGLIYNTETNLASRTAWQRRFHHIRNKAANTNAIWTKIVSTNVARARLSPNALVWCLHGMWQSYWTVRGRSTLQHMWELPEVRMWRTCRATVVFKKGWSTACSVVEKLIKSSKILMWSRLPIILCKHLFVCYEMHRSLFTRAFSARPIRTLWWMILV